MLEAFIEHLIAATQLKLDDLGVLKQLIQPVAAHWVALADQLGMTSLVETIRSTPDNTVPPAFLRDLLYRWLTVGHPTLEELCQALREDDEIIGGAGVAKKLRCHYQPGDTPFLSSHGNYIQHPYSYIDVTPTISNLYKATLSSTQFPCSQNANKQETKEFSLKREVVLFVKKIFYLQVEFSLQGIAELDT